MVVQDSLVKTRHFVLCIAVAPAGTRGRLLLPGPRGSEAWRDTICTDSERGALFDGLPAGRARVWAFDWSRRHFGKRDSAMIVAGRTTTIRLKLRPARGAVVRLW